MVRDAHVALVHRRLGAIQREQRVEVADSEVRDADGARQPRVPRVLESQPGLADLLVARVRAAAVRHVGARAVDQGEVDLSQPELREIKLQVLQRLSSPDRPWHFRGHEDGRAAATALPNRRSHRLLIHVFVSGVDSNASPLR